ncbi:MAG: hypothetical protein GY850_48300, partial [bacterium]|nr:hypothetical protein [bacterium]
FCHRGGGRQRRNGIHQQFYPKRGHHLLYRIEYGLNRNGCLEPSRAGPERNKTILHLDVAAENLGNMYRTTVAMCGDAGASLEYMLKMPSPAALY